MTERFEKWLNERKRGSVQQYVEELEKENAELKSIAEFQQSSNMKRHFEIQKLEKENEELKHNKKTVAHLADCLEEKMKERIEELEQQIEKMKCCEICNHNRGGCSYHHNWTKECLENKHKYFELKE